MLLPFTTDQFFAVFASYNAAIWPAQPVAYLLGAAALVFALRGGQLARRVVPAALAAMWLWTGAAYHLLHFAPINTAARFFGAAFLLQGLLFLAAAASSRALAFEPIRGGWRRSFGLLLVAYAAVLYPLLARLAGAKLAPPVPDPHRVQRAGERREQPFEKAGASRAQRVEARLRHPARALAAEHLRGAGDRRDEAQRVVLQVEAEPRGAQHLRPGVLDHRRYPRTVS